jgi:diaminohydroxyphosphoribosylaminopyrimidine deaminase / 5-amino-6-(5-phosphoribosylamino)uracil reductase
MAAACLAWSRRTSRLEPLLQAAQLPGWFAPLMHPLDLSRLQDALALATSAIGITDPNPRVGCVIGLPDGTVLGKGATQQAGGPHAEVMALRDAAASGHSVVGATAWVTLEPCAHQGRTPPCCDALVAAQLARVVVALQDPYPQVAGLGLARMRAAGVDVQLLDALAGGAGPACEIADTAWSLNVGFFSRVVRGTPWVRVKVAQSLDGVTALHNGTSQWITGEAARASGHAWRQRASAVLTGVGTVLVDNPRLDVRLASANPLARQPLRVVADSQLRTPAGARLLAPPGQVLVVGAGAIDDPAYARRAHALQAAGAEVMHWPSATGQVDLPALLATLAERGTNELHVEAGALLTGALAHAGLVDEWLVYLAPRLLGSGRGAVAGPVLTDLAQGLDLRHGSCVRVGEDLQLQLFKRQGYARS